MRLSVGEVGFLTASIKAVADVQIGDTVTEAARPTKEPFPGYQEIKPMVFAGLYPVDTEPVRRVARCARQVAAERCVVLLRAGIVDGAGFWFSLRLSRAAAHGDRAGAFGA